jgi:hypothetical protein
MVKRIPIRLVGYSKKFKGVKKLPAQKVPAGSSTSAFEAGQKEFTKRFGEKPQFMGFSHASATALAAKDLAFKTQAKKWNKFIPKITKRQRSTIASYAKTHKGQVTLKGIKKAKEQAFTKTLKTADEKAKSIFLGTHKKFTGR